MPTIIDSLIVELGLDPSKFSAGQKKAAAEIVKTKQEVRRAGKELEESGKEAERVFSKIRDSVIALFAAFELGRGLKEFIANITNSDAAVGRLAKTMDISGRTLASWRGASQLLGGSADGITQSMMGLSQQMQQFLLTGESSVLPYFRALGISIEDSNGHLKTVNQLFLELADRFSKMDPARAEAFGKALGFDQGTINLLMQGRKAVEAMLDAEKKLAPTSTDIAAAQARQRSFVLLDQTLTKLGRTLLTDVSPILVKVMDTMRRWVEANRAWIEQKFSFYVQQFAQWLMSVDWAKVAQGAHQLVQELQHLVEQIGGAKTTTEVLFALWAGNKVIGIIGTVSKLAGVFTTLVNPITAVVAALLAIDKMGGRAGAWLDKQLGTTPDELAKGAGVSNGPGNPAADMAQANKSWNAIKNFFGFGGYADKESDIAYFMSKGWSRAQAEGIVANLARESGGRMNAVGDNGDAYGLAQWHKDRAATFQKMFGHDLQHSTRNEQLDFIDWELRHGNGGAALSKATTASQAAAAVSMLYERPANGAQEAATRAAMAMSLAHNEVHIKEINVHTQATDADGIGKSIGPAIRRNLLTQQANSGSG